MPIPKVISVTCCVAESSKAGWALLGSKMRRFGVGGWRWCVDFIGLGIYSASNWRFLIDDDVVMFSIEVL